MAEKRKLALRLHSVTKTYSAVTAVRSLTFDVEEGRFFVLFGPSSVGKTTTLRTIAGLVIPESGRLEIGGVDMTHAPIAGRGISMVFQSFALYPHLTVYDNFAYPLREEGRPRAEIDRRVLETAEMLKLTHRLKSKPGTLSGGEQQRVALARAFMNRPKILFCDEPTGNLDGDTAHAMVELIFGLNHEKATTLVLVTHDLELAKRCHRIIRLKGGAVVSDEQSLPANHAN